jgi:hypothetical protein
MPERNLSIRLSVIIGGKVKAELKDIGESANGVASACPQAAEACA